MASEMLYPVMPLYLESIGFTVLLIGILEGIAEAVSGISKGYFGKWSDQSGRRLPFIRLGYGFSALAKPMLAVFRFPAWVFGFRTLDRFGKGLRTGPRDALLSSQASPGTKGRVFGFHRSFDTLGAALGPALALVFLLVNPGRYRPLFFIAFIPGLVAVCLLFGLREKPLENSVTPKGTSYRFHSFIHYWKDGPPAFRKLLVGLLLFALFNSSDYFLFLRMRLSGIGDTGIIGIYIFYNLAFAGLSYPLGLIGDLIGLKGVLLSGMLVFAGVYFEMAFSHSLPFYLALFLLYGVYAAATEGVASAWISNIAGTANTGTAIGTFNAFKSLAALLASSLAGLIWLRFGPAPVFLISSLAALLAGILLWALFRGGRNTIGDPVYTGMPADP